MQEFQVGFYRHRKGNIYYADRIATHSESGEKLVIYWRVPKQSDEFWARPLEMFLDGRFTPLTEKELLLMENDDYV